MSQKSPLTQSAHSVRQVLTAYTYGSSWRGGVFMIMQLLSPAGGGDYQYRIKSADEPHDRGSRKVNSIGQCNSGWHSTTTHRPSCLYPSVRESVVRARR